MSVYGGDSWAREAKYRKRRIDDLLLDETTSSSSSSSSCYKKLSSGKYACLICPNTPVLDTPLMLSMHMKGTRHCAAESRHKERELNRQNEINKRIALSENCSAATNTFVEERKFAIKPLIERTRKAVSDILHGNSFQQCAAHETHDFKSTQNHISINDSTNDIRGASNVVLLQQIDYRERRDKELKLTAAGWKRDGHGGWYRDENAEFDSDEEDPNISLA